MHDRKNSTTWLVLSPDACPEPIRELAGASGWPTAERVDAAASARIAAALGVGRVVLAGGSEAVEIATTLVRLDSTDRVACVTPLGLGADERRAVAAGVHLFDDVAAFRSWNSALTGLLTCASAFPVQHQADADAAPTSITHPGWCRSTG